MSYFIFLLGSWKSSSRKLSELIPEIKSTDYTNTWRRGTQLKLSLQDAILSSDEPVVIAVDSTGIKVTNSGEWMREKWKIHRGWIKVSLAANVGTKEMVANDTLKQQKWADRAIARGDLKSYSTQQQNRYH